MTQLVLEQRWTEVAEARTFLNAVGLPTQLGALGFDVVQRAAELDAIVAASLQVAFIHAEPEPVTPEKLRAALLAIATAK